MDQVAYVYDFAVLIAFEFILNPLNLMLLAFSSSILGRLGVLNFAAAFIYSFASPMINPQAMAFFIASVLIIHFVPLFRPREEDAQVALGATAGRIVWYFFVLVICGVLADIMPSMHMDDAWIDASCYEDIKRHGGILTDQPHVAVWIGALYYGAIVAVQQQALGARLLRRILGRPELTLPASSAKPGPP